MHTSPQKCVRGRSPPELRSTQQVVKNPRNHPQNCFGYGGGSRQPSAMMHYHPTKLQWGWECSCSQVNVTNPLQKCMHDPTNARTRCGWHTSHCWALQKCLWCPQNVQGLGRSSPAPLQKSIYHPQKCRGSAPAARSMQLFAKMHTSLAKMQGVGGRSRQPLAKLYHCPAKAAWRVRDASARINAMFGKDTFIPPKMVEGRILYPTPISTGCRQSPLRFKTASRESVHVHCSSSLVVSQKRQGKKCKNMIFWRRELAKTFSLSKTPQHPPPDIPEALSVSPLYGYRH